jgi:GntR family transcriptional repressor for pyruvate dehydrogenase complex
MAAAPPDDGYEPIVRQTVSQQVRAQLLERVHSGELAPGSPLPSERALSERFGVARTSVREAVQGLVSLGVVEKRGNRVCVAEHLPAVVVPSLAEDDRRKIYVQQLFETRRVLELPLFELAACRASPAERTEIHRLAATFQPGLGIREFRRLDRRFHMTIAHSCGNPLLVEVYSKVMDALFRSHEFDSLLNARENEAEVATIIANSIEEHHRISAALLQGDPVAVLDAVEGHLRNVERRMVEELV